MALRVALCSGSRDRRPGAAVRGIGASHSGTHYAGHGRSLCARLVTDRAHRRSGRLLVCL